MHNLEKRIAEWRRTVITAPGVSPERVDELENHLRENVDQLVQSGMTEAEAFQRTVEQLGSAPLIGSEFQKLDQETWLPIRLVTWLGAAAALALAIFLIVRLGNSRSSFLLATHVFLVVLGYSTTFLVGALGICFVVQRSLSDFSPFRMRSLTRATFFLGCIATALSMVGVFLGMLWAKTHLGRFWAWDPKELGAFFVVAWQLCFLVAHRFANGNARVLLVMSCLGNIMVTLGWFGTYLLHGGLHHYGSGGQGLFLIAAIICNLAFFLLGLAPAGWLRPGKTA